LYSCDVLHPHPLGLWRVHSNTFGWLGCFGTFMRRVFHSAARKNIPLCSSPNVVVKSKRINRLTLYWKKSNMLKKIFKRLWFKDGLRLVFGDPLNPHCNELLVSLCAKVSRFHFAFCERTEKLQELAKWLKSLPCYDGQRVSEDSNALEPAVVKLIDQAVTDFKVRSSHSVTLNETLCDLSCMPVVPNLLLPAPHLITSKSWFSTRLMICKFWTYIKLHVFINLRKSPKNFKFEKLDADLVGPLQCPPTPWNHLDVRLTLRTTAVYQVEPCFGTNVTVIRE